MTPDPGCGTSRWLHEQKAALKFQSACLLCVIVKSGRWEGFFKAHINAQHRLASGLSAETHHGTPAVGSGFRSIKCPPDILWT
jgi:hypothetical protein